MLPISIMRIFYTVFLILLVSNLFCSIAVSSSFGVASDLIVKIDSSDLKYSNNSNLTGMGRNDFNNTLDSSLSNPDNNKGVLIVKVTTVNGNEGMNKSSDFTINIHANNPIPSTFKGNSSGTLVELSMGMYSVTTSSIASYNTSLSGDCTGGIMEVETVNCDIKNIYNNS